MTFETVGEIARWRMIYPTLRDTAPDAVVSYETLEEILGLTDRQVVQNAVRRAAKELLVLDSRAVEAVPNEGYRVVTAVEHLRLSKKQQRRMRRAAGRGKALVDHVDLNAVPVELHPAIHRQQIVLGAMIEMQRRLEAKVRRHEEVLGVIMPITAETASQVDNILDRLNRAGIPE